MSQIAFYWEPITAIHNIAIALWVGSIFYYVFGLQSCLSLLDPTQKTSLQLQSLRKLFQFNWINAVFALISQAAILLLTSKHMMIMWSSWAAMITIILMIIIQFYVFTTAYRKARRALRPKPAVFSKINTPLKLIVFLGIVNFVLLSL